MDKKVVVITGANSGIGFETAKNLVFRGMSHLLFFPAFVFRIFTVG